LKTLDAVYRPPRRLSSNRRTCNIAGNPPSMSNASGGAPWNIGLLLASDIH
jgi:hypothetical protein